jgi:hypothetical protein
VCVCNARRARKHVQVKAKMERVCHHLDVHSTYDGVYHWCVGVDYTLDANPREQKFINTHIQE